MDYEKLDAWKACHALVLAVIEVTKRNARHERLARELRRYAIQAAGKLAFGSGTRNRKMFLTSVERTHGCLSAFSYSLTLARLTSVVSEDDCVRLDALRGRAAFYTWRLLTSQLTPPAP